MFRGATATSHCAFVVLWWDARRLQAALSGAEAARKQLEAGQGAGGSSELRAALARAAEAAARAATLQRQLETKRAQAAAAVASQREEVAVLKVRDCCQLVFWWLHWPQGFVHMQ